MSEQFDGFILERYDASVCVILSNWLEYSHLLGIMIVINHTQLITHIHKLKRLWLSMSVCLFVGSHRIVDWYWFEFKCQLCFDELPKLMLKLLHYSIWELFDKRLWCTWQANLSQLWGREREKCDDKTQIHGAQKSRENVNWFFIYMCQTLAADLFWSCFDMLIEWQLWHLRFHCARLRTWKRNVVRHGLIATVYWMLSANFVEFSPGSRQMFLSFSFKTSTFLVGGKIKQSKLWINL
jgi:hypothetical protein